MNIAPDKSKIDLSIDNFFNEIALESPINKDFFRQLVAKISSEKGIAIAENIIETATNVAEIIINELNLDSDAAIAYLVYILSKDLSINSDDLKANLNIEILEIVNGLKKISALDTAKYHNQTDNFIKLLLTISDDLRVILIKLASMLYQMRNLSKFDEDLQKKIATETSILYSPIAHRVGLYNIKTDFEDLCMYYFNHEKYADIKSKLAKTRDTLENYISDFIEPLEKKLKEHELDCEVFGRVKSIPSIWKKMLAQEVEFEKVYDLFAIRVIINSTCENEKAECWKVYSLVTEEYTPNPKRMRDWITVPKSSGYESLHATVIGPEGRWVEVQIRTRRMDEIAEMGYASHWKYKEKKSKELQADLFSTIREALQNPRGLKKAQSKEKKALYTDEIFVFTPKGDLKRITDGWTVLDFAYDIHTDIGDSCNGAIVNEKMVSIRHVLKNGDTVKISTSKNQKPNHSWLDFAKSSKAISKIKQSLKAEEYKHADDGKEIIKHKFESLEIPFNDINIQILATFYKCESILDLYQLMGEGKLDSTKIKKAIQSAEKDELEKQNVAEEYDFTTSYGFEDTKGNYLEVDNQSISYAYQYSKCCNPLPGDKIFAFVSVTKGLKIHKTNCSNAKSLITNYPYRVIEARWRNLSDNVPLTTFIKITAKGNVSTQNKICNIINNELKLQIRSSKIDDQNGGIISFTVSIFVNGKDHLARVISRLKKLPDVKSILKID